MNGERFDAGNRDQKSLYYWRTNEPNNSRGNEDCAHIYYYRNLVELNDINCSTKTDSHYKFKGLCEIC